MFDKDGILFEAKQFWLALARARVEKLQEWLGTDTVSLFYDTFGIIHREGTIVDVDPSGVFAIASPQEEQTITAALVYKSTSFSWEKCRNIVHELYEQVDREVDLTQALKPKPGFPGIFRKLRRANVPYGIATSDDYSRTRDSIARFDSWKGLHFVMTPTEVTQGKPHPEMLQRVSQLMGVDSRQLMMIGDSAVDMIMARNAGAIAVGIPEYAVMKERMAPYADAIIPSLNDIHILTREEKK